MFYLCQSCLERGQAHSYLGVVAGHTQLSTKTIYNDARPTWNQYLDLGCHSQKDKITINLVDVMHNKLCFSSTFEKWSTRTNTRRGLWRDLQSFYYTPTGAQDTDMFSHSIMRMSRDGRVVVNARLDVYPSAAGEGASSSSYNGIGGKTPVRSIGIAAIVITLAIVIGCCSCCCLRNSRRKRRQQQEQQLQRQQELAVRGSGRRRPSSTSVHNLAPGPSSMINMPEPSAPMAPATPMAISMRPGYVGR